MYIFASHSKTNLTKVVKETEFAVWIKISKEALSTNNDIYVCAVYIPPINSTFYVNNKGMNVNSPLELLQAAIADFQCHGDILLMFDFNAWTGSKHDINLISGHNIFQSSEVYNVLDKINDLQDGSYNSNPRNNCHTLNKRFLNLANLVRKFPGDPILYGNFNKMKKLFKS